MQARRAAPPVVLALAGSSVICDLLWAGSTGDPAESWQVQA